MPRFSVYDFVLITENTGQRKLKSSIIYAVKVNGLLIFLNFSPYTFLAVIPKWRLLIVNYIYEETT